MNFHMNGHIHKLSTYGAHYHHTVSPSKHSIVSSSSTPSSECAGAAAIANVYWVAIRGQGCSFYHVLSTSHLTDFSWIVPMWKVLLSPTFSRHEIGDSEERSVLPRVAGIRTWVFQNLEANLATIPSHHHLGARTQRSRPRRLYQDDIAWLTSVQHQTLNGRHSW